MRYVLPFKPNQQESSSNVSAECEQLQKVSSQRSAVHWMTQKTQGRVELNQVFCSDKLTLTSSALRDSLVTSEHSTHVHTRSKNTKRRSHFRLTVKEHSKRQKNSQKTETNGQNVALKVQFNAQGIQEVCFETVFGVGWL